MGLTVIKRICEKLLFFFEFELKTFNIMESDLVRA